MESELLTIVCWKWRDPRWPASYTGEHVNVLADMVTRNLKLPHRIICVTDDASGISEDIGIIPLWKDFDALGHCYRRLKIFKEGMADLFGNRVVSIDLDTVITGDLTELFSQNVDFAIAKDSQLGTPYNGSFFIHKLGTRRQVYDTFAASPEKVIRQGKAAGYCACDQAAIAVVLGPSEKTFGPGDGLYSFKNEIKEKGPFPKNARMIFFHGRPKPWDTSLHRDHPWIPQHYRRSKRQLLILGGAACVWEDLKKFGPVTCDVMVINDMGKDYPGHIKYWVSLHPEKFHLWKPHRKGNQDYETWSYIKGKREYGVDKFTPDWGGSSGLIACKIGLELGYDHITLAGVPMEPTGHYFDAKSWEACGHFRSAWEKRFDALRGKVFSLSGWTKEKLGMASFIP